MHRTPFLLLGAVAALAGTLSAQDGQALRLATEPAWGTALLEVPLHRSPSDASGEAAPLWAARAGYKV
ncbi:MAG: hypothetical protein JNM84_10170, partial [Planctomycetes bacterium]|nr:hypothetical protein [Planctomycetota bacterium]